MKKFVIGAVVLCFVLVGFVSVVKADPCEFYQWKRQYCRTGTPTYVPPPRPERLVLEGVFFDTGKATIKPESYDPLNRNIKKLHKRDDVTITVVGYTDSVGSDAANQRLSENRAKSVRDYFVSQGISPRRINFVGRGESDPIASNATPEGRSQNRRIEIEIYGK